ncbi:hypothetical protein AZO1586I_1315 [Bathymodiolus thermophilus thioautotrophic gill symbiont]|jgi:hypothetical protein|uniref:Uncharacterized protein n=3 Tax=sulfur-oxidizing symbionts TaxID=32036 RepID=A0ACA8ZT48_9GAMM|nr:MULTISPECIES: hypothetical protein [sulfur-oxidizing symbionts]CAC9527731.1 hypothetical protein [uncultured Gammaproteobacteria bacterium]CAB5504622.1 hypothetical protein AZO1586I_1315 [Bathymodiolus thermophilus thioautotrophic gill symbiont]CAB5507281.1 hypothetical protein AZO1586R_2310 [Bathymodiolus azoricus thioautotrophic gill symbiont]CAC9981377.1 hypothetical protein [uncultured Gammaproteobacteria bacterium]CAC9995769.1 hypothetical protein [uncultured Gammaproteobacteria bacter
MLFCHNIFSKKVTIKQGYLVVGEQNKSNSNAYSKEYMEKCKCIPNLVFWNSKFEDECLIEFDHTENDLSFIFNQCHFAKKLKIRNSEKRVQLRNGEVHGTDFGRYEISQKTKLHLEKLHLMVLSNPEWVTPLK